MRVRARGEVSERPRGNEDLISVDRRDGSRQPAGSSIHADRCGQASARVGMTGSSPDFGSRSVCAWCGTTVSLPSCSAAGRGRRAGRPG